MAMKTEKVKEPSSGETIASVADRKDLDERMIRFQALVQGHDCSQEYHPLPGEWKLELIRFSFKIYFIKF